MPFTRRGLAKSGEEAGHPFRGNQWTKGSSSEQREMHDVLVGHGWRDVQPEDVKNEAVRFHEQQVSRARKQNPANQERYETLRVYTHPRRPNEAVVTHNSATELGSSNWVHNRRQSRGWGSPSIGGGASSLAQHLKGLK